MKMLITLEPNDVQMCFDQILHTYKFGHCRDTGMQNSDNALLSISRGQMLITLEQHDIF